MTAERAREIIRENAVWDSVKVSCPNLQQNIVDAIMCAVEEEREACARIAAKAAGPFPGVGLLRMCADVAKDIRARGEA